jgi:type II secretory pathway pseudopilin PulG
MGVASGMGSMPLPTVTVQAPDSRSCRRACRARRSPPCAAGAAGFSLVEVLVATGLLMTAVASLAPLFVMATRANAAAGDMTTVTILAAQKVEELRAAPFLDGSGPGSVDVLDARGQALEDAVPTGAPAYLRHWQIDNRAPGTLGVTVVVSTYRAGAGRTSSIGNLSDEEGLPREIVRIVTLRTRGAR